jgi:hypothetical protein
VRDRRRQRALLQMGAAVEGRSVALRPASLLRLDLLALRLLCGTQLACNCLASGCVDAQRTRPRFSWLFSDAMADCCRSGTILCVISAVLGYGAVQCESGISVGGGTSAGDGFDSGCLSASASGSRLVWPRPPRPGGDCLQIAGTTYLPMTSPISVCIAPHSLWHSHLRLIGYPVAPKEDLEALPRPRYRCACQYPGYKFLSRH